MLVDKVSNKNGYHHQYLEVNVSTGECIRHPLETTTLKRTIGGSGLGTLLLLEHESWSTTPSQRNQASFLPLVHLWEAH